MNFSIIGTGFIMPRHAEAIDYINGKIIDIINTAPGEDKWKEIVKNPKTDCIVILTPNDLHFKIALAAVKNNKMVLCEKPLTINSDETKILAQYPNIFTVLQLRYHPLVKELKKKIKKNKYYEIKMDISVHRDKKYYQSWKGQKQRSGGLLFNLGIHYFDLLLYLFGKPKKVSTLNLKDKTAYGIIEGDNYICHWKLSTNEKRKNQHRVFKINDVDYNLSSKDNLSYENLHRYIYQKLLNRKGISPDKTLEITWLIEQLYIGKK